MCVFMSKKLVSDMFFLLSQACAIMQPSRWRGTELCGSVRSEIFVHRFLKTCFSPVHIDHICRVVIPGLFFQSPLQLQCLQTHSAMCPSPHTKTHLSDKNAKKVKFCAIVNFPVRDTISTAKGQLYAIFSCGLPLKEQKKRHIS